MALVQDDHVVQALATDTPDESLDIGVLPRTPGGDQDFLDPHMPHPLPKSRRRRCGRGRAGDTVVPRPTGTRSPPAVPSTAPWDAPSC